MINCHFESIALLSTKEATGRTIAFGRELTIVTGQNGRGKSCLLKSLYRTLGAEPAIVADSWEHAEVKSLVQFVVNGNRYFALRAGRIYAIFDSNGRILLKSVGLSDDYLAFIAMTFDFGLRLVNRKDELETATPAFLFLPYYVDQDASWFKNWSSFAKLQQFKQWRRSTVEYHLGMRSNAYFSALAELASATAKQKKSSAELLLLKQARVGVVPIDLAASAGAINLEQRSEEIQGLLSVLSTVRTRETKARQDLQKNLRAQAILQDQRSIASKAARELKRDYAYATADFREFVTCPTCGTQHDNQLADRFGLLADASRCRDLEVDIAAELSEVDQTLTQLRGTLEATKEERERIEELLSVAKDEISLQDIIQAEGRRTAITFLMIE